MQCMDYVLSGFWLNLSFEYFNILIIDLLRRRVTPFFGLWGLFVFFCFHFVSRNVKSVTFLLAKIV